MTPSDARRIAPAVDDSGSDGARRWTPLVTGMSTALLLLALDAAGWWRGSVLGAAAVGAGCSALAARSANRLATRRRAARTPAAPNPDLRVD